LFWDHCHLAYLFRIEDRPDDAQAHIEHAKSHAVNNEYNLGSVMGIQAGIWYSQDRLGEARAEVLRVVEILDKLGAASDAENCRGFLRDAEKKLNTPVASGQSGSNCERFIPLPRLPLSSMFVVILLVIFSRVMYQLDYSVLSIIDKLRHRLNTLG